LRHKLPQNCRTDHAAMACHINSVRPWIHCLLVVAVGWVAVFLDDFIALR
jgi:hypothetical protein